MASDAVACAGKVRFEHFRLAKRACHRAAHNHAMAMCPYRCDVCGGWHVGSHLAGSRIAARAKREKMMSAEVKG